MPGLGATFGRGGATTTLQDLANADCILIQGSSMAEAHPVGFRWVMKAKEKGAKILHVDPRFSRTSALADLWVPIRAGADIVLLGALVSHVLEEELFFRDYVLAYTNAPFLLRDDFRDTEDLDGVFSGWDEATGSYDPATWAYRGGDPANPERDESLTDPRCVFQVLKRHFRRYTPEMVERLAGVPPELFHELAEALTTCSGPEKTTALCYALGWTHHSKGVQVIRTAAILQLLLGNMGRPGGGILALRGHASIQGSTDIPTLYDLLPGYLPMPALKDGVPTLEAYLERHTRATGWWSHTPKYLVSLLKAYYGPRAQAENDFGYDYLPQVSRDHSHLAYFTEMRDGAMEGLFVLGQNPAVGGQNARLERRALARLSWLVVRDLVEIETASFWRDSPEIARGELAPEEIDTEVFLFPAAGHVEKAGTFTQTQRMLQWRTKAVEPPGEARSEAWFIHQLALRLKAKAEASDDPRDEPLRALDWWYPEDENGEPSPEAVLAEIHGWRCLASAVEDHGEDLAADPRDGHGGRDHGAPLESFTDLKADGSTACGCWIYSGVYAPDPKTGEPVNRAAGRTPEGPYAHGWGWAWPADRRILYNRASARPDGQPWSEAKALVWWDEALGSWGGHDVPDFPATKPPGYRPDRPDLSGVDAHRGDAPFLMQPEGVGRLFVPSGLADGPLPTHYEPLESPSENLLYSQRANPAARAPERPDNRLARPGDPRYPYVLTTYRLTEHHTAGGMSRWVGRLAELQPELFVELSPELAAEVGLAAGGWATIATPRGEVEARVLVTRRLRPLSIDGRTVHQVAMPFHWGSAGPVRGDVVNDLIPITFEPNVSIHESKALTCSVAPGRRGTSPP